MQAGPPVNRSYKRRSRARWPFVLIVAVLVAAAAGLFLWRTAHPPGGAAEPPAGAPAAEGTSAGAGAVPAVRHPIEQAAPAPAMSAPLPALDESDTDVTRSLLALAGDSGLDALLLHDQLIRRIVATVDALPRQGVATRVLPVRTPKGSFLVEHDADGITLSPRNVQRYAPYMRVLQAVDPRTLVAWYVRHYPLFQQAYQDLGYPKGYFNDRLVAAIDDMLAAPLPPPPLRLVQPKVFYRYADPELEARSAGQKMLLRLGPADAAQVQSRLRTLRALLTGATLPPAPAPAPATSAMP
jgi:hypothetical protein